MTDQNSQFFAMLTAVGEAKQANADALGIAWKITQMGVGDANGTEPTPDRLQTALLNERRRAPLNQLKVDPSNASIIIAEQVIPEDVGGWWIREIGLYDEAGDLVAIANCAPSFKPQLSQGSGRTQVVRMNLIVSSAANVELKIDPSVVLATRKYVDDELAKRDDKNSVRVATTAAIVLSGTQTIDGIALIAGDRVLVKDQAAGATNGIYVVAAGAWVRATDADTSIEATPGMLVPVEQGTANADTVWQLVTDGAIVLGTTALAFELSAALTASQTDAETGTNNVRRMTALRVFQAFSKYGLGATSAPTLSAVDDSTIPSGLYQVAAAAIGLPIAEAGFIDIRRGGSGLVSQRFFSRISDRCFFRRASGAFAPWLEIFHTGNFTPAELAPPGEVAPFAMSAPPAGWLKANGAVVSRTTYAALFAAIGTTWGAGDGATTFGLPDLRGEFPRYWDDGRGVDAGRAFGSFQADQNKAHTHALSNGGQIMAVGGTGNTLTGPSAGSAMNPTATIASSGGTETRTRNIALLACIKY